MTHLDNFKTEPWRTKHNKWGCNLSCENDLRWPQFWFAFIVTHHETRPAPNSTQFVDYAPSRPQIFQPSLFTAGYLQYLPVFFMNLSVLTSWFWDMLGVRIRHAKELIPIETLQFRHSSYVLNMELSVYPQIAILIGKWWWNTGYTWIACFQTKP